MKKTMVEEAKACDDCLCWLKYCKAECCSEFHFLVNPRSDVAIDHGILKLRIPMTPDRKWYYRLHGVKVVDDVLHIPQEYSHFTPTLIVVRMKCNLLTEDNLCLGHPDSKPDFCKSLKLETAKKLSQLESGPRVFLTPNCLFNFKK